MNNFQFANDQGPPSHIGSQLSPAHQELQPNGASQVQIGLSGSVHNDVRRARALRSLRRKLLGSNYYSGPSFEILLHLYDYHLRQLRNTVGNIVDGAGIPMTTTLRWIDRLAREGLLVTKDDPLDARRKYVELTPDAVELMTRYFVGATTHLVAA
jgi:DNA-binding MarR family transcriptional regulator